MIPATGQRFIATIPAKAYGLSKFRTGTAIGWHTAIRQEYTLVKREVVDNDTDREFKLIRADGAITEVEAEWFNQRKINLVN